MNFPYRHANNSSFRSLSTVSDNQVFSRCYLCLSVFICGSIIVLLGVLGVLGGSIIVLIFLAPWRLGGENRGMRAEG